MGSRYSHLNRKKQKFERVSEQTDGQKFAVSQASCTAGKKTLKELNNTTENAHSPRYHSLTIIRKEEDTGRVAAVGQTAATLSIPGAVRGLVSWWFGDRLDELRVKKRKAWSGQEGGEDEAAGLSG